MRNNDIRWVAIPSRNSLWEKSQSLKKTIKTIIIVPVSTCNKYMTLCQTCFGLNQNPILLRSDNVIVFWGLLLPRYLKIPISVPCNTNYSYAKYLMFILQVKKVQILTNSASNILVNGNKKGANSYKFCIEHFSKWQ